MIIQHNISAMNANRQLNITGGALTKSTRNLSSGYKINVAADDAAGLSISEKMRRQIRGLTQGVQNTEDGVSLCQVADGALSEVQDMLQRINELAVQAANGTNSESDRSHINDEVTQLLTEIDRIGDTTKFNEVFIFKGTDKLTREKMVTIGGNSPVYKPHIVDVPSFDKISLGYELKDGPIRENTRGNRLDLVAKAIEPDKDGNVFEYRLIQPASSSQPKIVVTASSVGAFEMYFDKMPKSKVTSVLDDKGRPTWSRVFTCSKDGVNLEITQKVTLNPKEGTDKDRQYYTIDYIVENKSSKTDNITFNLVQHEDTVYGDDDRNEKYYLSDSTKVTSGMMFTSSTGHSTLTNNPYVTTSSIPDSFSVILEKDGALQAVSFTENILISDVDAGKIKADTLIMGEYYKVGSVKDYTASGMSNVLGKSVYDWGFSLVWSDQTINKTDSSKTFSFKQGIVNTKSDKNIPQKDVIILDKANIAPPPPEPVLVTEDYIGGNHQHWIQSGGEALDGMVLKINSMNTGVLDINDISTLAEWTSDDAIDRVSVALSEISKQRSLIGAYQNRLEHTIANEDNIVENTTAAESQIRDTDMAKEMVEYSNKNILMQAGQAMLSQANQSTQGVLSLIAA